MATGADSLHHVNNPLRCLLTQYSAYPLHLLAVQRDVEIGGQASCQHRQVGPSCTQRCLGAAQQYMYSTSISGERSKCLACGANPLSYDNRLIFLKMSVLTRTHVKHYGMYNVQCQTHIENWPVDRTRWLTPMPIRCIYNLNKWTSSICVSEFHM